ncbi:uncharacterized protein LOC132196799 [Neocloeon triangulifer]|uniref:uncharacterized protein LOC132196799 n=1 Tax=Neocloeon triangulifer TaxID=2078957 RepID=UPI00286F22B0|nr:uncharacterized protein LOC132196799 [Neocloeon triangulifer]XP_059475672.1 uncharacterized protein LOC132196799 [Neocloeon triangulifer]XP_059475673.1 uncharacterized protein LOC132196799 [Neocloeon triangulifer]
MEVDDLKVEEHECRTCGRPCTVVAFDLFEKPQVRMWLEKTLSLKISKYDGKSHFVCTDCSQHIKNWNMFRAKYQRAKREFEKENKAGDGEVASNKNDNPNRVRRLQKSIEANQERILTVPKVNEEKDIKPTIPMRIKIEPKIEADLFNTFGFTEISAVAPVPIKQEIKMEHGAVKTEVDDDDFDYSLGMTKPMSIEKRLKQIKLKFKKIGEREKKKKLIREQEKLLGAGKKKNPRERMPTKNPRKSSGKEVSEPENATGNDSDKPNKPKVPQDKKSRPMPLSKKKRQSNGNNTGATKRKASESEDPSAAKKICLPASLKTSLMAYEKQIQENLEN